MNGKRPLSRRLSGLATTLARSACRIPAAIGRWLRLPRADRRPTLRAFVVLMVVEASIRWARIPRLAERLGIVVESGTSRAMGPAPFASGDRPAEASQLAARSLTEQEQRALRCTRRIIRPWPFGTGPCLRESLVLGNLLRAQAPVLRFGVERSNHRIRAHAWIEVAGRPVNDPRGFTSLRGAVSDT
jgi:hypothetical protein